MTWLDTENKFVSFQILTFSTNLYTCIQLNALHLYSLDFQGIKKFVWPQKQFTIQYGKLCLQMEMLQL